MNIKLITLFIFTFFLPELIFAKPQISFPDGLEYNWGIVKPKDSPLNAEIMISNTGTDTLHITNVKPTCGCTNAPLRKDLLAPGEATSLMVTLTVANYSGEIEKIINIFSNDPDNNQIQLKLKADIKRDLYVTPSSFFSFTDVQVGETRNQMLTIHNDSDNDVTLRLGTFSPNNLQIKLRNGQKISKGGTYNLEVSFKPEKSGIVKGKIQILTDNDDFPEIPIFIFGDIAVSPLFIGE
ncbi:MAG: hypothetical protein A2X64_02735 [Ignavibacteria bacterium GWF2_33_9]|nr:MAG: hypothetical protein A2X64_02735 [Ignavibacteria bacterium GWF2_33_9]